MAARTGRPLALDDAMTWGVRDFLTMLGEAVRLRLAEPATWNAPRQEPGAAALPMRQGRTG